MTLLRLGRLAAAATFAMAAHAGYSQISLQSAVNLALKNSPKVRVARADYDKAVAARSEARDAYIPTLTAQAGYGQSTGAPLNVPVIFSMSAQSLVFSFSQRDYIRSGDEAVKAAELLLHSVEVEIVEDTTNTYLALDYAVERQGVLRQSLGFADQLVTITNDRIALGVDAKVELPRSRRTATQLRLAALQIEDDIAANQAHLARLTGLPAQSLVTDRSSVPDTRPTAIATGAAGNEEADSDGIRAAFASARSKQYVAFGDKRYMLRPQISLAANYSRVATFLSTYSDYYPRYSAPGHSENAFSFGLQFNIPIMDMAHRAKARQTQADATRAFADADQQRGLFQEGRAKLRNAARELDLRASLARDDREIAQDQLETIQIQLQQEGGTQGPQVTPKDRLNAALQERQKFLDVLNAELQLRQTQVNLLRQTDSLGSWIISTTGRGPSTPTVVPGSPATPTTPPTAAPTNTLPPAPSAGPRP